MYQWILKKYSSVSTNDPYEEGENFHFFFLRICQARDYSWGYDVAGVQVCGIHQGIVLVLLMSVTYFCMFDAPNTFLPPILFTN